MKTFVLVWVTCVGIGDCYEGEDARGVYRTAAACEAARIELVTATNMLQKKLTKFEAECVEYPLNQE